MVDWLRRCPNERRLNHVPGQAVGHTVAIMTERQFRTVLEGGSYFEGPRWHDGAWWVSDFYRHTVSRVGPSGGAVQ